MDKAHILEEIRRTAAANNGRPLGMERFCRQTGIGKSDWLGKYWSKWGDAVRECGLEPNQMQHARNDDDVLEQFIGLMRELGKLPTWMEVRLKARNATGFPWHNTFARFGSKQQLIARIMAYCAARPEYADVVALCAETARRNAAQPAKPDASEELFGFVYLLKSGRYYKIGKTNAAGRRERELAIQLPEKAETVHVIRTDDPSGIEEYWHRRFHSRRKNGEWFDLSALDIQAFKRRRFFM